MSAPIFYTDTGTGNFVGKIQQWGMLPNSQSTWTTTDIIQAIDDEFVNSVIPMIKGINEEYFVNTYDTQVVNSWDGQIAIPADSIGLDLRDVWAVSGDPNSASSQYMECRRFNPNSMVPNFLNTWNTTYFGPAYYVQNNILYFYFNGASSNFSYSGINWIRTRYYKKPNHLTSRANCALVLAVNGTTITTDNSNTNANFTEGQSVDFILPYVPFPFDSNAVTISNVTVGSLTTTFDVPAGTTVTVGDLVCPQGFAPVFQYVPEEIYNVVCQYVVVRYLDAQGDTEGYQRAAAKLQQYFKDCQDILTPKIWDQPKKIVTKFNVFDINRGQSGILVVRN